jgi:hypothetical protein
MVAVWAVLGVLVFGLEAAGAVDRTNSTILARGGHPVEVHLPPWCEKLCNSMGKLPGQLTLGLTASVARRKSARGLHAGSSLPLQASPNRKPLGLSRAHMERTSTGWHRLFFTPSRSFAGEVQVCCESSSQPSRNHVVGISTAQAEATPMALDDSVTVVAGKTTRIPVLSNDSFGTATHAQLGQTLQACFRPAAQRSLVAAFQDATQESGLAFVSDALTSETGNWTWSFAVGDLDADLRADVWLVGVDSTGHWRELVLRQDGPGRFADHSAWIGAVSLMSDESDLGRLGSAGLAPHGSKVSLTILAGTSQVPATAVASLGDTTVKSQTDEVGQWVRTASNSTAATHSLPVDLDGDGVQEIISWGETSPLRLSQLELTSDAPGSVCVGDVNHDGALDIVSIMPNRVRVFSGAKAVAGTVSELQGVSVVGNVARGVGCHVWEAQVLVLSGQPRAWEPSGAVPLEVLVSSATAMQSGDVDAVDGRVELVAVHSPTHGEEAVMAVWEQHQDGWKVRHHSSVQNGLAQVFLTDVNDDGALDVLVTVSTTHRPVLRLWLTPAPPPGLVVQAALGSALLGGKARTSSDVASSLSQWYAGPVSSLTLSVMGDETPVQIFGLPPTGILRVTQSASPELSGDYLISNASHSIPQCDAPRVTMVSGFRHGSARIGPAGAYVIYDAPPPRRNGPVPPGGVIAVDSVLYSAQNSVGKSATASIMVRILQPTQQVEVQADGTVRPDQTLSQWMQAASALRGADSLLQVNPSFSGGFNNLEDPKMGAAFTPLVQLVDSPPFEGELPSARVVSNEVFAQTLPRFDPSELADIVMHLGQFIAHDTDFVTPIADFAQSGNKGIAIPKGDVWLDPEGEGSKIMHFRKSGQRDSSDRSAGASALRQTQQVNKVTSWLDVSPIYGSDSSRSIMLRAFSRGRLRSSRESPSSFALAAAKHEEMVSSSADTDRRTGYGVKLPSQPPQEQMAPHQVGRDTLPFNTGIAPNLNPLVRPRDALMLSGDNRANVQGGLLVIHTIFARLHNINTLLLARWEATGKVPDITDEGAVEDIHSLLAALDSNDTARVPSWYWGANSDEHLFLWARELTRAQFQSIVLYEYVPAIVGDELFQELVGWGYEGYDDSEEGRVSNEYATVAFRFGHSQVGHALPRLDTAWCPVVDDPLLELREAYFAPWRVLSLLPSASCPPSDAPSPACRRRVQSDPVETLARGMLLLPTQAVDPLMSDDVRNLLFGPNVRFDLISFNIQRGRDHQVGTFQSLRRAAGLKPVKSFQQITGGDEALAKVLAEVYSDRIEAVDAIVGALSEPPVLHKSGQAAAVGETVARIVADQFARLRRSDRFWFENEQTFAFPHLAPMLRRSRLADVLRITTDVFRGPQGRRAWEALRSPFSSPLDPAAHDGALFSVSSKWLEHHGADLGAATSWSGGHAPPEASALAQRLGVADPASPGSLFRQSSLTLASELAKHSGLCDEER